MATGRIVAMVVAILAAIAMTSGWMEARRLTADQDVARRFDLELKSARFDRRFDRLGPMDNDGGVDRACPREHVIDLVFREVGCGGARSWHLDIPLSTRQPASLQASAHDDFAYRVDGTRSRSVALAPEAAQRAALSAAIRARLVSIEGLASTSTEEVSVFPYSGIGIEGCVDGRYLTAICEVNCRRQREMLASLDTEVRDVLNLAEARMSRPPYPECL